MSTRLAAALSPERLKLLQLLLKEKREGAEGPATLARKKPESKHVPASFAQRRFWFLDQIATHANGYTIDKAFQLKGAVSHSALSEALNELQRRHESLRTTFEWIDGDLYQVILPHTDVPCPVEDLTALNKGEQEERVSILINDNAERRFDLRTGPLWRTRLLQLAEDEYVMFLALHHIICDGWSIAILLNDLAASYEAYSAGTRPPFLELKIQYAEFAVWQREYLSGDEGHKQRAYWSEKLRGLPPFLSFPTDLPRSTVRSLRGAMESIVLPASIFKQLHAACRVHQATPFMLLLTAYFVLLFRYSSQSDFAVGAPIANRRRSETEALLGAFVNTLLLRVIFTGTPSVRDLIAQVRDTALGAYAHQDVPFEQVLEDLYPERSPKAAPVLQALFVLRNEPAPNIKLADVSLTPLPHARFAAPFELELSVHEIDGELSCWMLYDADLFEQRSITRMLRHFRNILEAVIRYPDRSVGAIELLTPEERTQMLRNQSPSTADFTDHGLVHQRFEHWAARFPEATAIVCDDTILTYNELNRCANRLAHYLRKCGVRPEARIVICTPNKLENICALLGVLKAGGAYVPIDPGYPDHRLRRMLEDSAPTIVLARAELQPRLVFPGSRFVDLSLTAQWRDEPDENPNGAEVGLHPENVAYIIYTSGSTGAPKGVAVHHRALCNQMAWLQQYWEWSQNDRILQFASANFDVSIQEIFSSFISGAALVLAGDAWQAGAHAFWNLCDTQRITAIDVPTKFWQEVTRELPSELPGHLRMITIGGEAVEENAIASWFSSPPLRPKLYNAYGPTEATINSTIQELTSDRSTWRSIGAPLGGLKIYILDIEGELAPPGVAGEIYISGISLARGYLNRPDLTAERFLPDPYGEAAARMYRTGDIGRKLADGGIQFLGRSDQQVKIRGYRIELEEIQAMLLRHPDIEAAVVTAATGAAGDKRLVAYFVETGRSSNTPVARHELRQFLSERLPGYMVPSVYVRLRKLPMTSSGKVDRNSLPEPEEDQAAEDAFVEPSSSTEHLVAEIWREVLGLKRAGIRDDFFASGGHSITAMRLLGQIQTRLGRELPLATLFESPTIEQLALRIDAAAARPAFASLVCLRGAGSKAPLFLVHPVGGSVYCYKRLSTLIDDRRPVHAFEARALSGFEPHASISAMSETYLEEMIDRYPQGPYFLAGWSMGGVIAFEMAQQLQRRGLRAACVSLFDSHLTYACQARDLDSRRGALLSFARDLGVSPDQAQASGAISEDQMLRRILTLAKDNGAAPSELSDAKASALFNLFHSNSVALANYQPSASYAGRVLLFKAAAQPADARGIQAWSRLCCALETHIIPGGHYELLVAPGVHLVARKLNEALDAIEADLGKENRRSQASIPSQATGAAEV
ncbi:MAG: amino acid adenylation domain-containing protein [Acidobacteriaceae bacterium]|nr:amino acid adenylation domain-containing protein [Acidobacteriaceae bacterium]